MAQLMGQVDQKQLLSRWNAQADKPGHKHRIEKLQRICMDDSVMSRSRNCIMPQSLPYLTGLYLT